MRFVETPTEGILEDTKILGFERNRLLKTGETILIAIVIILVVLLVVQPMVGRLLTTEDEETAEGDDLETDLLTGAPRHALEGPGGEFEPAQLEEDELNEGMIDVDSVQGKVKASSVKKVEDIVENFPEETVSVIRSWMAED